MDTLRTPDASFADLEGYPFAPHYVEVDAGDGDTLRMHTVDEGDPDGPAVLLLHGEPSWSYLYRRMIPVFVEAGHRVVAPDLVGFGRSDKPVDEEDYTYARHVDWTTQLVDALGLDAIHLFCQDWGGLIGLRMVAEAPDRFAKVVAANTFLPTGEEEVGEAFERWQQFSAGVGDMDIGQVVDMGTVGELSDEVRAGYDAPFPDARYKAGAHIFPRLVPTSPDDPGAEANRAAWEVLRAFERPFLTAFGDSDPITRGADRVLQREIPGAQGQPHTIVEDAGHFLQEDRGEELARICVDFFGD
jgi:haloalkane dehalogenase